MVLKLDIIHVSDYRHDTFWYRYRENVCEERLWLQEWFVIFTGISTCTNIRVDGNLAEVPGALLHPVWHFTFTKVLFCLETGPPKSLVTHHILASRTGGKVCLVHHIHQSLDWTQAVYSSNALLITTIPLHGAAAHVTLRQWFGFGSRVEQKY